MKQEPTTTTAAEFAATPSRTITDLDQDKERDPTMTDEQHKTKPKTVTPPDVKEEPVDDAKEKNHVRFGEEIEKESSSAKHHYEESIEEMQHADLLIERILFLEGVPEIAPLSLKASRGGIGLEVMSFKMGLG